MLFLGVITAVLLVVTGALFVAMFRRDDPLLGLVALVTAMAAAIAAVIYGGVDSS